VRLTPKRCVLILFAAALLPAAGCLETAPTGPTLAACISPEPGDAPGQDWSNETIRWTIAGSGPFVVRVGVPVADLASTPEVWLANLTLPAGWAGVLMADHGVSLELQGHGSGTASSCSIQPARGGNGCCAEGFLQGVWSTTGNSTLAVDLVSGDVLLEMHYAGHSRWSRAGEDLAPTRLVHGWQVVDTMRSATIE